MPPLEYVRVRDKSTGHHYSVLAAEAENHPDAYQVLKQDAVDANGDPLPGEIPDNKTTSGSSSSAPSTQSNPSGSSAGGTKEN